MNQLEKFRHQVRDHLLIVLLADNAFMIISAWYVYTRLELSVGQTIILSSIAGFCLSIGFTIASSRFLTRPVQLIWQAIVHVAPKGSQQAAPNLTKLRLGKDMVANLVTHIYQLASVVDSVKEPVQTVTAQDFVTANLPLPLIILDADNNVVFANQGLLRYINRAGDDLTGQSIYSVLDMSFTTDFTFERWLTDAQANKAIATQTWDRVRINLPEHSLTEMPQCDLAAYYNRDNPDSLETIIVLFDHTQQYAQDDQAMSFVALAVHELRTPLTLLRGYIEVFEDELKDKVSNELADYIRKMAVAAQQLSTFTNTILNVSRIENDQFELKLHKEQWSAILQSTISDLELRAEVRGIHLELEIAPDLPAVGVDRVSIYEVLSNLIDNAIKYSNGSNRIVIKSYLTHQGLVETTIQDFGVGIPESAIPHLFDKFYRNQRSRAQIGGTGLGLFLAKSVVEAHGGQIWVNSTVGQGSIFGFSLLPYSQVLDTKKSSDGENGNIVRSAHGWIKNHSMYRR